VKKFRFRFQTVENVKKREEDLRRERLAEADRTLQEQEALLAGLHQLRDTCQRRIAEQTSEGRLNATEIALSHVYLQKVTGDIQRQQARVEQARREMEARREVLMQAARERKMFENLKARDQSAHRYEESRQEQALMDEIAGRQKGPSSGTSQQPPAQ
jgi:flagellar FliJ protein